MATIIEHIRDRYKDLLIQMIQTDDNPYFLGIGMQNMIDLHKEYDVYADGYEQHDEDMLRRR
jgi:hypothetical protein